MEILAPEQMTALTRAVVTHMDEWKISSEQMLGILGVENEVKPRHLSAYRKGERALPQHADVMLRIDHIVGISDALRTTFPFSSQMRVMWLRKPHRRFQKRTPLDVMLSEGVNGLQKVRIEVDCAYGYAINDAMHAARQQSRVAQPET
ncbi:MAG: antitoxin Xre/MbcA/ParS toxin-binding domain-containing protein [Thiolinea sp.]